MHYIFAVPKLRIEGNCRIIPVIGLNEGNPCAGRRGDLLHSTDQRGGDAHAATGLGDGKIVEIIFATWPFELRQVVGDEAPDDFVTDCRHEGYLPRHSEFLSQILVGWRFHRVTIRVVKGLGEQAVQCAHVLDVVRTEPTNVDR